MTVADSRLSGGRPPEAAGPARGFVRAAERFVAENREGTVIVLALAGFLVLWTIYDAVSFASVDQHSDISELWGWAQNFGFGVKHPPLQAWVFGLWFAVFPRADWATYLLAVTTATVTLAITWRLLRDHLDGNRALIGLTALFLVPLYTLRGATLDANTVIMPFWAAALLFYLRARRGFGVFDAVLTGAFVGLAFLGKYWTAYLVAGMAAASLAGNGARRFWRSPAPYLMAAGAAIVIGPHLLGLMIDGGGATYNFVREGVMNADSFGTALVKSGYYLLGAAAYVAIPLIFLAALRPDRAALADIAWPADPDRQQALLLFAVPLVLPALVNLALPHRLTPIWTYPNWALLPVVLYGSPLINVDARAGARACLVALAVSLAFVGASPLVAYWRLDHFANPHQTHYRQVAEAVERFAGPPPELLWGCLLYTSPSPRD